MNRFLNFGIILAIIGIISWYFLKWIREGAERINNKKNKKKNKHL